MRKLAWGLDSQRAQEALPVVPACRQVFELFLNSQNTIAAIRVFNFVFDGWSLDSALMIKGTAAHALFIEFSRNADEIHRPLW
jgi:hypothetical protein